MDFIFKVRLSEVKAKQLNCPGRTANAMPFFRLNFNGKVIESDVFHGVGDAAWQTSTQFDFRLQEPDLQTAMSSLQHREAVFEILFTDMRGGQEVKAGACVLDLLSLCTGAATCQFTLQAENGSPCGSVSFCLVMEHMTTVALRLDNVEVSGLPSASPYRLLYNFASLVDRQVISSVSAPSNSPQWTGNDLPPLTIRSSLRGLLDSTVRVSVEDMNTRGSVIATIDLKLKELLQSNANHSVQFKLNAYLTSDANGRRNAALATGILQLTNMPVFAQLEKGENNNGSIFGKPLLPTCPLPSTYSKHPKRLPELRPGQAHFELAQDNALRASGIHGPNGTTTTTYEYHSTQQRLPYEQPPAQHHHQQQGMPIQAAPAIAPVPQQQQHYQQQQQHYQYVPQIDHSSVNMSQYAAVNPHAPPPPPAPASHVPYTPFPMPQQHTTSHSYMMVQQPPPPQASFTMPPASLHPSMMMPNAAAPIIPTNNLSPLSHAGDSLIKQHHETVNAVEQQQRRIMMLTAELNERTAADAAALDHKMRELQAEENQVREDLRRTEIKISELQALQQERDVAWSMFTKRTETERHTITAELDELEVTFKHLQALARNVAEHAQEDERTRARARQEVLNATSRLQMDTRDLSEVESRVVYRLQHNASMPMPPRSASPFAAPLLSAQPARPASPFALQTRAMSPHRSPPRTFHSMMADVSNDFTAGTVAAAAADADELVVAVQHNHAPRAVSLLRVNPQAAFGNDNLLHMACTHDAPSAEIVRALLDVRPELVGGVDTSTGCTALHFACNARFPSLEVVELLLAKGSRVAAMNDVGLNAFHVALRNPHDPSHQLATLLLLKGGADVRMPTGKGESPLHMLAVSDRYLDAVRFLLTHGADPNARSIVHDQYNRPISVTPLEKAMWYGPATDEIRLLLRSLVPS